ncbi:MAG: N-acetyltransferase [Spirochaetales bacterium]|nr:N-acetyltransferase [Spirochaetales bacterium]
MAQKTLFHIRRETPADYTAVYRLVRRSFATTECADGDEPEYLEKLRRSEAFIPELSLLAEGVDGTIVGQIVLYKTVVTTNCGNRTELCLSPLSVDPKHFRRGIAGALTEAACEKAHAMGFAAVFLCGSPEIYRKLGFLLSYRCGIRHVDDVAGSAEWCMVRELRNGTFEGVTGQVDIV